MMNFIRHHRGVPGVRPARRGFAMVLAMLYLVLFSVMALGLYAAATTSNMVAYNESHNMQSLMAAENGLQFIRYQLDTLDIPYGQWDTQTTFNMLTTQLHTKLDNTTNMVDVSTGIKYNPTTGVDGSGNNVLYIPGQSGSGANVVQHWISLDSTSRCYITITQNGTNLTVKVTGRYGNVTNNPDRAVQITFNPAENAADIFSYGVASKSPVTMNGNVSITGTAGHLDNGSVLSTTASATPLSMTGGPSISGNFAYTNPSGHPSYGNGTIAGESPNNADFSNHVKQLNVPPDFPVIDTTVFKQSTTYTTMVWSANPSTTLNNVIIPTPPAGKSWSFNNANIQGVMYIMQPNSIKFAGNTSITGAIVVDNTASGNYSTNTISFNGGVTSAAMSTLPANATFPAAERGLSGAFLLAPNFSVSFGGNFHTVNGTIVADQMSFSGNAQGTVSGTIINMQDSTTSFSGNNTITIASQGTTNYPAGVYFGSHYKPAADTYAEVHP